MEIQKKQFEFARQEIERHIEDATISKSAHFVIADLYKKRETRLQRIAAISFSGVVLSWFVSTQIYAVIEGFGWSIHPVLKMTTQTALPIGFVIANLIATTFLFLNRYGEKSYRHREAAQKYHRFFRKCFNWQTECPDFSYVDKLVSMVSSFREELSEINHSSPDIEEWAWKVAGKEIQKGGTTYNIDGEINKL